MKPNRLSIVFAAASVITSLAGIPTAAAQWFSAGKWVRCDSVTSDTLSRRAIMGPRQWPQAVRVLMTVPGKPVPTPLYLIKGGEWYEPVSIYKRAFWPPTFDSVTLAVRRRVDMSRYPFRLSGDEYEFGGYSGTVASILWDRGPDRDRERTDVDLEQETFSSTNGGRTFADTVVDVGFLRLSNQPSPVLYSLLAVAPPIDEAYLHLRNVGVWHFYGDKFVPLASFALVRAESDMDSYERPHDLETEFGIDDVGLDGDSEIVYRRTYIIADQGRQTNFSDPGTLVFEYDQGDPPPPPSSSIGNVSGIAPSDPRYIPLPTRRSASLVPTQLILPDESIVPARPFLPILVYPGSGWWSAGWRSPKMNGSVPLGTLPRPHPMIKPGDMVPGPNLWIEIVGDSIYFRIAMHHDADRGSFARMCDTGDYSVVLWVDADLYGDFHDPGGNSDDFAYILYRCSADSIACVDRFSIEDDHGSFRLVLESQSHGVIAFNRYHKVWPDHASFQLPLAELGLSARQGLPTACGFAIEVVCSGTFMTDSFAYLTGGWTYPPEFNRTDPRTWSWLMVADRKDTTYSRED